MLDGLFPSVTAFIFLATGMEESIPFTGVHFMRSEPLLRLRKSEREITT